MDNTLTYQNFSSISSESSMDTNTLIKVDNILGTAEVADILQCPKQQIYTLRKRKDFPKPIRTIAATPLWHAEDIRAFASTWVRRKPKTV